MTTNKLIVVLGPTATGKTRFAACLAAKINGEIISADSRQIYRSMDLGTGKDYEDYLVDGKQIPYHLIDIHDAGYKYNVFEYQQDFTKVYKEISDRKAQPILCGGTGLYIEAVTKNYKLISVPINEELREQLKKKTLAELAEILAGLKSMHNKSDLDTTKRAIRAIEIETYYQHNPEITQTALKVDPIYLGIHVDRDIRRQRITERLKKRLAEGMVEEVQALLDKGIAPEDLEYYGLEYKFLTHYLTGKIDYNTLFSKLNTAIHQFAKRQMTWFRRMERQGAKIHWIDGTLPMHTKLELALEKLT